MVLDIDDIWTAINKGREHIAMIQLRMAKKSTMAGDIDIFDADQLLCMKLYASIYALGELCINNNINQNLVITKLYNNIKLLTKDIRQWD